MKLAFFSTFISLTFISTVMAGIAGRDVIYGSDNRKDVFESNDRLLVELSRSTAAMIPTERLKSQAPTTMQISGTSLEGRGICSEERFSKQVTAANCSGFLVSSNVLVTAGHCIRTASDCANYKWVFDYKVSRSEQSEITVKSSSVYSCKKVMAQALSQVTKEDYAVIELDRPVTDRNPLIFRKTGKISLGESVAVIGHPTGLPTKITDGGKVRQIADKYFVTNLDTFGGNSGSAVFNSRTGIVEGILVRGENDFIFDEVKQCQVSNNCAEDACRGEDVTHITIVDVLKYIR